MPVVTLRREPARRLTAGLGRRTPAHPPTRNCAAARSSWLWGPRVCGPRRNATVSLTGLPLLLLVGAATLVAPRRDRAGLAPPRDRPARASSAASPPSSAARPSRSPATFLAVNRDFVFYASWARPARHVRAAGREDPDPEPRPARPGQRPGAAGARGGVGRERAGPGLAAAAVRPAGVRAHQVPGAHGAARPALDARR